MKYSRSVILIVFGWRFSEIFPLGNIVGKWRETMQGIIERSSKHDSEAIKEPAMPKNTTRRRKRRSVTTDGGGAPT